MVQVKKAEVRQALLDAAKELFLQHGYAETQLSAIAAQAGTSKSNIYKYFGSKFDLLMALYDPWLRQRVELLETATLAVPRSRRLRRFLRALLEEIPQEDNGFANLLMQALATAPAEYSPDLLHWFEGRIVAILRECVDDDFCAADLQHLAELLVLVHDGFLIASRTRHLQHFSRGVVDLLNKRLAREPK